MEAIALAGLGYSIYTGTKKKPKPAAPGAPPMEISPTEEFAPKKKKKYRPMMFMGDESLSLGIAGKTAYGGEKLS